MEFLLLALLPFLAYGVFGGSDDDHTDGGSDNGSGNADDQILRDDDMARSVSAGPGDDLVFGAGGGDTLSGDDGMDALVGETGADLLFGGAGDDLLLGAWGNDELSGGAGDDALIGGSGQDLLSGDGGDDLLVGSSGADTLNGGDGDDEVVGIDLNAGMGIDDLIEFSRADLEAQLTETYGSDLRDSDVDRIVSGAFNANLADQQSDELYGGAGNDALVGDNGDLMQGDGGTDEFNVFTSPGDDVVTIADFAPDTETLQLLVDGPATGAITYQNDADLNGVEVLLDGEVVVYLQGVLASMINPAAFSVGQIA